jgi:hypothetical protein
VALLTSLARVGSKIPEWRYGTWLTRVELGNSLLLDSSFHNLEDFPTVCTNPLRAKSLFATASPKSDLRIVDNVLL